MSRYIYSIVRCLPDPRTGEFMNVGAIAGDPATGDWAIRQLSNTERVRKFAGDKALKHALNFVYVPGSEIDQNLQELDEGASLSARPGLPSSIAIRETLSSSARLPPWSLRPLKRHSKSSSTI
jgi:hypothetical protein